MQRLAEAGERRLGSQVRPQALEDLLAMEPVVRLERQELDQRLRFGPIPLGLCNPLTVALDIESTEHAYVDGSRPACVCPSGVALRHGDGFSSSKQSTVGVLVAREPGARWATTRRSIA
jgi:hypothetical protein